MRNRCLISAAIFAIGIFASARHTFAADCNPDIINVAQLENRAVVQNDKFWGTPEAFGKTAANVLAHVIMTRTGMAVGMVVIKDTPAYFDENGRPLPEAAKEMLEYEKGCLIVYGSVDSALVYARNSFKFKPSVSVGVGTGDDDDDDKEWYDYISKNITPGEVRRKFRIESKARLLVYDRRTGELVVNDAFTGTHETSMKDYSALDKDKKYVFAEDPSLASGSPLGVPFVRMFSDLADKINEINKN